MSTFHILMASLELLEMKIKPYSYNCSMKMSIYEIKWTTKAHSDKIKIDENLVLPEYKSEYIVMKEKFEKSHLMIKNPLTLIELEDGGVSFHKNNDFQILTAPWEYEENGKTLNFFNAWKKDRSRRE